MSERPWLRLSADDPHVNGSYVYALLALSVLTGVVLAAHRTVTDAQLLGHLLPLVVVVAVGAPVVVGYSDGSFHAGVLAGILPPAGAVASIFARPPLDARVIESVVAAALHGTALALPVATVLVVIGVGLRRDGSLTDQRRGLAFRVVAAVLVAVAILWVLDVGLLQTYGDQ